MKSTIIGFCFFFVISQSVRTPPATATSSLVEQKINHLPKAKLQWLSDKNVKKLDAHFHDKSKFVSVSGTVNKEEELEIIQHRKTQQITTTSSNKNSIIKN